MFTFSFVSINYMINEPSQFSLVPHSGWLRFSPVFWLAWKTDIHTCMAIYGDHQGPKNQPTVYSRVSSKKGHGYVQWSGNKTIVMVWGLGIRLVSHTMPKPALWTNLVVSSPWPFLFPSTDLSEYSCSTCPDTDSDQCCGTQRVWLVRVDPNRHQAHTGLVRKFRLPESHSCQEASPHSFMCEGQSTVADLVPRLRVWDWPNLCWQ